MRTLSTAVDVVLPSDTDTVLPPTGASSSSADASVMPPIPPTTVDADVTTLVTCTDVLVTVSDDTTAKVFYFNASQLMA
jgi:hypothetical protein